MPFAFSYYIFGEIAFVYRPLQILFYGGRSNFCYVPIFVILGRLNSFLFGPLVGMHDSHSTVTGKVRAAQSPALIHVWE